MADWFAQNAPKQTNADWFAQNAPGQAPVAPNAGLAPPPRPKFLGAGPTKQGSSAGQSPLITNAPEESGLETGPLLSYNPAENSSARGAASPHFGAPPDDLAAERAFAREVHSAGQALNPVTQIPAMFHAAFDKPEESQQAAEEGGAEAGGALSGIGMKMRPVCVYAHVAWTAKVVCTLDEVRPFLSLIGNARFEPICVAPALREGVSPRPGQGCMLQSTAQHMCKCDPGRTFLLGCQNLTRRGVL